MKKITPFIITISRQLGSGGAYVGQKLAKNLNIFYADREIISQAAKQLSVLEEDLESRDEKIISFWQSLLTSYAIGAPDSYIPPQIISPTDHILFKVESEIIERIAKERSAVIIGRCASHILRYHTNHISIFLHSNLSFRKTRVQEIYNLSEEAAEKMIAKSDKDRAVYYRTNTGKEWTDIRNYDLSIDTGKIGLEKSLDLIIEYLE